MSKEAERELAAFLASLPDYQRKSFESGLPSLTQDEMQQWAAWMASSGEQFSVLQQEYFRLLQSVPAKLKEYRDREQKENQKIFSPFLPKGQPGRKRNDELAARIRHLHEAGKTSKQIQMDLKADDVSLSIEAVEAYLKTRRTRSR